MKKLLNKILTILGILFIIEIIRRVLSNPSSDDFTQTIDSLKEKVKDGEIKLKEIESIDYDVDSIVDDWNDRMR